MRQDQPLDCSRRLAPRALRFLGLYRNGACPVTLPSRNGTRTLDCLNAIRALNRASIGYGVYGGNWAL